ncbi:MOSC domain-containing protein [Mycobacterium sp. HNNTM2301]|uniref:MOSC domain-containing protein n=1 Tax=Mycobacterium hainanense TaxID=3289775 RepID=UPI0035A57350
MNPEPTGAPPTLLSVNIGRPVERSWAGGTMNTAIWKSPAHGPQKVRRLNIDGDEQADKIGHGGEHRAILVYQTQSYTYWQEQLGRDDFSYGQFGENFTIDGLSDTDVHIGDRYRIGTAVFEVTQPRVTCYKLGVRMGVPTMAALLVAHHRPGFYFRVLEEGEVCAGDTVKHLERPAISLSVADIDALLYLPNRKPDDLRRAMHMPALSRGWRDSFAGLLAKAQQPTSPAWNGFQPVIITELRDETPEIRSFTLAAQDGTDLPAFAPGQYLTIRVPATTGKSPAVRNYSLSSPPTGGRYRISVKREDLGVVSAWLHANLAAGNALQAAQPRGDFVLSDSDRPILFASAGIGVTPLLSMLYGLAAKHSRRHITWLQVAKNPTQRPFCTEVADLLSSFPAAAAHIFYTGDIPPENPFATAEHLHYGRPAAAALSTLGIPADSEVYICGPVGFMTSMTMAVTDLGIDPAHIFTEAFGPSAVPHGTTTPHAPDGPVGEGPSITFSRSGIEVPFSDRFANLLELAEACDVPVHWSCRTGVCQTCITSLISGNITYQPQPLDQPGPESVLLCCATPVDSVVLDA